MDRITNVKAAASPPRRREAVAEDNGPRDLRRERVAKAAECAWPETMHRVRA